MMEGLVRLGTPPAQAGSFGPLGTRGLSGVDPAIARRFQA